MSTLTPNFNLSKPEPTDPFGYNSFLPLFNDNMDIIDANLGGGGGGGSANQNIAENYDDTLTYSVGDYVIYNGLLYKCDTAVSTAEAFDPTKWTHVVVTDELGSGGSGGHTIYDEDGTALAQENGLQFTGAVSVSDDAVNGRTVVDIEGGGNYYLNTIYSTEEKKVGYWTDGKPIYQRVWDFGSDLIIGNNTFYTTNIDSSTFETIVEGFGIYSTGVTRYNLMANTNGTNIRLQADRANGSANVRYLVLQYTKTTDTPEVNPQTGGVIYLPTIYSFEERQVGVWTDGKPLYEITLNFGSISANSAKTIDVSSLNIDFVTSFESTALLNNGTIVPIPISHTVNMGSQHFCRYNVSGSFGIYTGAGQTITQAYLTARYTKTTDTAGSGDWSPSGASAVHYSTNEQVIGTWIDGKPLYQKTIILGSLIMDTSFHSVAHGISDFELMVQAEGSFYDGSQWRNIETYRPTSTYGVNINVTPTNINYINNWVSSVQQAYVTIWYTKTSD